MGVYIDMEMPTACGYCPCARIFGCICMAAKRSFDKYPFDNIEDWCLLVPVPEPHGRLGDLDRLEQMFIDIDNAPYSGFDGTEPFYSAEDAAQIIRLAPTVIPANTEEEKMK